ncbi:MAG: hypothetical protein LBG87_07360, partial [Spirochaetaceae bacterium]|nr:hypothetical protein [Spirochaetaceae bacterium]
MSIPLRTPNSRADAAAKSKTCSTPGLIRVRLVCFPVFRYIYAMTEETWKAEVFADYFGGGLFKYRPDLDKIDFAVMNNG